MALRVAVILLLLVNVLPGRSANSGSFYNRCAGKKANDAGTVAVASSLGYCAWQCLRKSTCQAYSFKAQAPTDCRLHTTKEASCTAAGLTANTAYDYWYKQT